MFCGCCIWAESRWSQADFHRLISLQVGSVLSKQECCRGVSWTPCGRDCACQCTKPRGLVICPSAPLAAPISQRLPHLLLDTPRWPCCLTTPRLGPSACLSWPEDPHGFSVILQSSFLLLLFFSGWKNVNATQQMEAGLTVQWQEMRNFAELNKRTWRVDPATTETTFPQIDQLDRKISYQLHVAQLCADTMLESSAPPRLSSRAGAWLPLEG